MRLSDNARTRSRNLSGIAAGLSILVAATVWFGMNDHDWTLLVPVLGSVAAIIWPTRVVVGGAMVATALVVALGLESSGILFGASVVALMLALNSLQEAATRVRRPRRSVPAPQS